MRGPPGADAISHAEPHLLMMNIDQARAHFQELSQDEVKTQCP